MMCVMHWAITEERCRAFEGQRLPAAVDFPMPINIVMRRWLRSCSGRCSVICNHCPQDLQDGHSKGFLGRFKRTINVVDSTTIALIANCMYWAKHRRRKAAAKCHLRLALQSFLPRFAIIDTAKENDAKRAREVCAGLKEGEIVLFDKAYVDFEHLF